MMQQEKNWRSWEAIFVFISAGFKMFCGLAALSAVVFRKPGLASFCHVLFKICIWVIGLTLLFKWTIWIILFCGLLTENNEKWKPDGGEIFHIVTFTLGSFFYILVGRLILSTFKSLNKVFKAKGNGWEGKNYKEILEKQVSMDSC